MIKEPPYGLLLAVTIGLMLMLPAVIGDGEAVTEAISELLSPLGLLLVPLILIFTIRFLSSDLGSSVSNMFSTRGQDSSSGTGGTPTGSVLFLALALFLLYIKVSIFGGDSEE